jgi:toluene monooxygenase electron transfer component
MIAVKISDKNNVQRSFEPAPGQRLLQAGLAAGLGLPYECATGSCGNCKATIVNGDVRVLWPEAPGKKVLRNANEVLLCQAVAKSSLELTLRSAFTAPCDPQCKAMSGKISLDRRLTTEISTFVVALKNPISYQPGQFVLLGGLGVDGPRAYSMIRHKSQQAELHFLIRKSHGGAFTKALFDDPSVTKDVTVFGPLGRATFLSGENRPFVAIAGGSGIAGMLSILDHALESGHFERHRSHIFFGLRDAESSYLLDELASMVDRTNGKLKVTVAFSDMACPAVFSERFSSIQFADGFIHDVAGAALKEGGGSAFMNLDNPLFFAGGPPAMVDATMRMLIAECKVRPTEIRYDRFG